MILIKMNNEDERILERLKTIKNEIGHFPTPTEFYKLGSADLYVAIDNNGGINKFRVLLGEEAIIIPFSHWTEESVLKELKNIKSETGHFPSPNELSKMGRGDLISATIRHGGFNKFKELLGVDLTFRYWTEKTTIEELKRVTGELGHFPTDRELLTTGRGYLRAALIKYSGINRFRTLLGEEVKPKFPDGYWTDETIIENLKEVKGDLGHFPTGKELLTIGRKDLRGAIIKHGSINRFRTLLGEEVEPRFPDGYWTDETILIGLKTIKNKIGHFPTPTELSALGRSDLMSAIYKHGGMNRFRELIG